MAFMKSVVLVMLVATSLGAPGYAPSLSLSHAPSLSLSHAQALAPAVNIEHSPVAVAHAAPIAVTHEIDHYATPHYEFKYGVQDGHTHDIKEQAEKRVGDKVEGYYSLLEPDGTKRTVHYTADHHTGFNAVVSKSGHATHSATPAHAAPVIAHAAPVIAHAAPIVSISHAAPSISYAPIYSDDTSALSFGHGYSAPSFAHEYGSYH